MKLQDRTIRTLPYSEKTSGNYHAFINRRNFLKLSAAVPLAFSASCSSTGASSRAKYQTAVNTIWRPSSTVNVNALEQRREWVRMATLAASSHNVQPWKFKIQKTSITIYPDYSRRCPAVDPDDSHLFKSLGCAAENIVQAAAADGFGSEVHYDAMQDAVVIEFNSSAVVAHGNLSSAITLRRCSRIPYDGKALSLPLEKKLIEAASTDDIKPYFLQAEKQKEQLLEYVRQGNLAQFNDSAFVDELRDWVRFNIDDAISTGDGLAGTISGQASVPAWLGRRLFSTFLSGEKQAEIDATNIRSSAGLIAFVGNTDDKASWVAAGRAFERFALQAAALNIRTAFINQPIEVRQLRPQLHNFLGVSKQHVHLLVRYGTGPSALHSLRRPVSAVLINA